MRGARGGRGENVGGIGGILKREQRRGGRVLVIRGLVRRLRDLGELGGANKGRERKRKRGIETREFSLFFSFSLGRRSPLRR